MSNFTRADGERLMDTHVLRMPAGPWMAPMALTSTISLTRSAVSRSCSVAIVLAPTKPC